MSNERIDSAMAEKILQGDDTDPDILRSLGLELIAELKRCYEELDRKDKWLEELDRCPTCGKEGFWATADTDAEFDDDCRRCGRDNNASE